MLLYPKVKIFYEYHMSKFSKLEGQDVIVESTLQNMQTVEENTIIKTIKNVEFINLYFSRHIKYPLSLIRR